MKKFLNYKTGLFCGGAILGVALISIVGCGQSSTPVTTSTAVPGVATTSASTLNGAFQYCMSNGGMQVTEPSTNLEACRMVLNYQSPTITASSGGVAPINVGQAYTDDTLTWSASGTWDTGTSYGACSGQNASTTSEMIAVETGTYTQTTIPASVATVISYPVQLTWEIVPPSGVKNPQCARNISVTAQITRCVDINNNPYQCN